MDRADELFALLQGGRRDKATATELAHILNERARPGFRYAERGGRVIDATDYSRPNAEKAD